MNLFIATEAFQQAKQSWLGLLPTSLAQLGSTRAAATNDGLAVPPLEQLRFPADQLAQWFKAR
jgi:hypothetical protein